MRTHTWFRTLTGAVCVAAAFVSVLLPQAAAALGPGSRAAEIDLLDLAGRRVTLGALRGRVVIVDTWATWCGPCEAEFAALQNLYGRYHGRGLEIVAVSSDSDANAVRAFASRHHAGFTVVHDPTHIVTGRYDPPRMPSTYVIDKRGVIRFVHAGFRADSEPAAFDREVQQLLAAQ